jgi:DNA-binding MurR/RpiR family transcriptional regulator
MIRAAEPSPLQLIRDALPTLAGARRRVAQAILDDPFEAGRNSITWLAELAQTQPATVTRLSTALGYNGFPALRAAVANEGGREIQAGWESDIGSEIAPGDASEHVMNVLAGHQARAIRNAMSAIDLVALEHAADRIASAARVHIFGEWGDKPPAEELYMRLLRIGVPVWTHEGAYAAQVGAAQLGASDVAIVISRSGESAIASEFLNKAHANAATTVLITGETDSPLAVQADIVLFTGTAGGHTWTEYFAGRASDAFLAGLLWMLVAQRLEASFILPAE